MKKRYFPIWLIISFCLSLLWACSTPLPNPSLTPPQMTFEWANDYLHNHLLPVIDQGEELVPDALAQNVVLPPLETPLPNLNDFPLYGAQPSNDPNTIYLEIFSSSEKANAERQGERWLVDVAEAFNAQSQTLSGKTIQVGIRNIPSGLGAQLLAAKAAQPAGYSPANELWLAALKSESMILAPITSKLVPNHVGFVVQGQVYQDLAATGEVTFNHLLDSILAGKLTIGYPNPYTSSSSLNLLYTLFWQAAGHDKDGKPLVAADLQSPQVSSVFETFQKQVSVTTLTTLDLKDIFLRDQQKLQAFPLEYQNYKALKQIQGFEQTGYIPFGVPHNSPLVGFNWNTPLQQQALEKFAQFATSAPMQQLAQTQGFEVADYLQRTDLPPMPEGAVLQAAQSFWKQRKDGGRTAYMMLVIDTSGSMEQDNRLKALQDGLQLASKEINTGNQVGLVTFSDRPIRRLKLSPFNDLEHKRLVAAINELKPDGNTALYDGLMVGLADLMEKQKLDPDGRFYLLLLSDGEVTQGLQFSEVQDVLQASNVRIYPIAYGEVNQQEMQAIATTREGSVYSGNPETVQSLLRGLFQANL
jgi:Ca-activated chloride channel homolog